MPSAAQNDDAFPAAGGKVELSFGVNVLERSQTLGRFRTCRSALRQRCRRPSFWRGVPCESWNPKCVPVSHSRRNKSLYLLERESKEHLWKLRHG